MKILKRAFASILAILLLVTSYPAVDITAEAASDEYYSEYGVTYEQLFTLYPQYLSPEYEDIVLDEVLEEIKTVIDSYSDVENGIASYMYSLKNGVEILGTELLSLFGLTDNTKTKMTKDTITLLMKNICGVDNPMQAAAENVGERFKYIEDAYNVGSATGKLQFVADIKSSCENISDEQLDKILDEMFEDSSNLMSMAGDGIEFWQLVTGIIEMQEIEEELIYVLLNAMSDNSAIKEALVMLLDDMDKDIVAHVFDHYCTEKAIEKTVDVIKAGISATTNGEIFGGGLATAIAKIGITIAVDYLYTGAMADDIVQLILLNTYLQDFRFAIDDARTDFVLTQATTKRITDYKLLYNAYIQALKTATESASKLAKSTKQKDLMRSCLSICNNYTYDSYINSCMINVKTDIDAGKVKAPSKAQSSGNSNIDVTEEESRISVQEKFRQLQAAYPPNQGVVFNQSYGGAIQCFGFARFAFNKLFDCDMPAWYVGNKRYMYGTNQNVVVIGQLAGSAQVNATSVKNLLQQALVGDIIQACGSFSQHTMMVVGADADGITVYECNWGGDVQIHQRKISYASFAADYGTNHAESECGVTLYRAANYDSLYWDGSAVFYDDSVNFVIEDGVLTKYNGWQAYVTIPEEVTAIGEKAFYNNDNIRCVTMTDNVTSIGSQAFERCDNLYYCRLSNNLEVIEFAAFADCTSITGITMPDSITKLANSIFYDCKNLKSVKLSNSITTIPSYIFLYCKSLEYVTIPDSVTTLNAHSFYLMDSLKSLTIPDSITEIPDNAIMDCPKLTTLILPDTLTAIGDVAIAGCEKLNAIKIPASVTTIGNAAFSGCSSLSEITIPEKVNFVGSGFTANCTSLKNIYVDKNNESYVSIDGVMYNKSKTELHTYPAGKQETSFSVPDFVTDIYVSAFSYNANLEHITLTDSVLSIGDYAFEFCTSLSEMTIPDSVTEIKSYTFSCCDNLKTVNIPDSVTEIESYAFSGCDSLINIEIPDGIKIINSAVFSNCSSLRNITIPDSVQTIDYLAFHNCSSLESIVVPDSVNTLECAFTDCSALENIVLPDKPLCLDEHSFDGTALYDNINNWEDGVLYIGNHLIKASEDVTKVNVKSNIKSIAGDAFRDCINLSEITIPDSVGMIGAFAFENTEIYNNEENWTNNALYVDGHFIKANANFSADTIADGTKTIADRAFLNCSKLTDIKIPESVKTIGNLAFYNCSSLESIEIPASVEIIGDEAFYYASINNVYISDISAWCNIDFRYGHTTNPMYRADNLYINDINGEPITDVVIPNTITSISKFLFSCSSIRSVVIPDSVTTIGEYAFFNCNSLTSVIIPDSVTSIGQGAFASNSDNLNIYFEGSESDFEIIKYDDWDENIFIHYNFTGVAACEHTNIETKDAVKATCTKSGYSGDKYCSDCGTLVLKGNIMSATGHSFGEWTVTTEATYINEGVMTRECVCGETETSGIEKLEPENEVVDTESNVSIKHQNDTYNGEMKVNAVQEFDGESFQILNNEKGNFKNMLYDITTTVNGEKVQPEGYVLVGIPLPEGYNPEKTVVYFVANDGNGIIRMDSYFENGYVWFETNHFSSYALVDESEEIIKPEYMLGDVNGDGKITAADARIVLRASAKLETLEETSLLAADINKDNKITAADARTILRVSAKLETL